MAKTLIMPGTKEARETEEFLKKVPPGTVPAAIPLIGGKEDPPKAKYVKAVEIRGDGKMYCTMVTGQIYCVIDAIKANTLFHRNEGIMLAKLKQLIDDKKTALHNRVQLETEVKDLKRRLKKARKATNG